MKGRILRKIASVGLVCAIGIMVSITNFGASYAESTDLNQNETLSPTSTTQMSDGGNIFNFKSTNIDVQFPVPPSGFNPLTATDTELDEYGFPTRPTDSERLSVWTDVMKHYKRTLQPETIQLLNRNQTEVAKSTDQPWAGYTSSEVNNSPWVSVWGEYIQPEENTSTQHHSSDVDAWVGLGGYYNPGLIQCGTTTYTKPSGDYSEYTVGWFEYLSTPQIDPVYYQTLCNPGDTIFAEVDYNSVGGTAKFDVEDVTTGTNILMKTVTSLSTDYDGSHADWTCEQSAPYLLDCYSVNWSYCYATNANNVTYSLANSNLISVPLYGDDNTYLMGPGPAVGAAYLDARNAGAFWLDASLEGEAYYPGYPN